MIVLEGVTKVYNQGKPNEFWALRGVSLEIKKGEVVVLKGPSGSGKTTLLSIMGCMARPTSGRVLLDGRDIGRLPEVFLTQTRRQRFGFIFQDFNLLRGLSVAENIILPLYPEDLSQKEIKDKLEDLLERFHLKDKAREKVEHLSGGQQQRVAIARALVNGPEVVFADEPTAHLDTTLSKDLVQMLEGMKADGITIVIATHDPIVFEAGFVDRVIQMRDGRLITES
ncbi:MAG: ABC transporter ATP-binding protein [Nitrospirae bacterium]|nr:MAG: ABC transporter ATP-binding protein [Nitrospirota bacterium]